MPQKSKVRANAPNNKDRYYPIKQYQIRPTEPLALRRPTHGTSPSRNRPNSSVKGEAYRDAGPYQTPSGDFSTLIVRVVLCVSRSTMATASSVPSVTNAVLPSGAMFTPRGEPYNGVGVAPHQLEPFRARDAAIEYVRSLLAMRP